MDSRAQSAEKAKDLLGIVLMAILLAVVYGIVHDQITIRLSREYFTVEHPLIFGELDDTRLALCWGVAATWWMGMIGGTTVGLAAVLGPRPPLCPRRVLRAMLVAMLVTGICAALIGWWSWEQYQTVSQSEVHPLSAEESASLRSGVAFMIHSTSYTAGGVGFLVVAFWSWWNRVRAKINPTGLA